MNLETERLILRQWKNSDFEVFAEMNADDEVMKYFPSTLSREESDVLANKITGLIHQNNYGLMALELKSSGEFIGFTGLHKPEFKAHFTPCAEIGWRIARKYWGNAYAAEAARACLEYAFNELYLKEVVSFTALQNARSVRVMEKIGMKRDLEGDFDHPSLPETSPLKRHLLYRISKQQFISFS